MSTAATATATRLASRGVARSTREIPFARNSARSRRRRDDARRRAGHRRRHHPIANGIRDRSRAGDSIVVDARARTHRFVDAFTVVNFLPKTADCVRDAMIDRCVERARARCDAPRGRARAGTTRARSDRARMIFIDPSRKPHDRAPYATRSNRHHSTRSSFYDAIDARRLMAVRSRRVRRARRVRRRATSRRRARRRRPKCATRRTGRRRRRGRDGATDRRDGATRSGSNAP